MSLLNKAKTVSVDAPVPPQQILPQIWSTLTKYMKYINNNYNNKIDNNFLLTILCIIGIF